MNQTEDKLLQALLTNPTRRAAAQAAGMSERQAYNISQKPEFQARYRSAQDDLLRRTSNNLRRQMDKAVNTIAAVMGSSKSRTQDRLAASKMILEFGLRFVEAVDIVERIAALEAGEDSDDY